MTAIEIGERHAQDWFARLGKLIVGRPQTYRQAISGLNKICETPLMFRIARQAFDRRLGRLVADSPGTISQPPKRRRRL